MKTIATFSALLLAIPAGSWRPAPGLEGGRYAPTATLLRSAGGTDTVLVVGGYRSDTEECQRTAQLYDSASGRFTPTGSMSVGRNFHTATLLADGQVLVAGGFHTRLGTLTSAELYDPTTGAFHGTASSLSVPRELYTATRLPDGRVLLAGGFNTHRGRTLASAELYDSTTRRFTAVPGPMAVTRFGHDALWVPSLKKVLIAGGKQHDPTTGQEWHSLAEAELFDPESGQFTPLPPMRHLRDRPTLSLLPDGRVLVAGGKDDESTEKPREAEIFDPARVAAGQNPFLPAASLQQDRFAHQTVTLRDGRALLMGGWSDSLQGTTAAAEIYNPVLGAFTLTTDRTGRPIPMNDSRLDAAAVYLPAANRVLVVGGQKQDGTSGGRPVSIDRAELYAEE
jgi:acyl CoA:acetate/3-ketoacid CoA transferase alpha subunit